VRTDRRRDRRALATDELRALLASTAGPTRNNIPGPERALLYRLAVGTGLRAKELRSLSPSSFDLSADAPAVTVAYSKRWREDTLPLRPELVTPLKSHLATRQPAAPAFRLPKCRKEAARMFRADVEAAGLAYRDGGGRVADFHALRHTFITNLARGGVHPKTAQALARHSTITLTMDRYSHTLVEELADALKALPDLSKPVAGEVRATGTHGAQRDVNDAADLASCLARSQRFRETSGGANGLPGSPRLESQHPEDTAVSAVSPGLGGVCTAGAGPGLQNQRGV
jgi:integrase/recombinase XerD